MFGTTAREAYPAAVATRLCRWWTGGPKCAFPICEHTSTLIRRCFATTIARGNGSRPFPYSTFSYRMEHPTPSRPVCSRCQRSRASAVQGKGKKWNASGCIHTSAATGMHRMSGRMHPAASYSGATVLGGSEVEVAPYNRFAPLPHTRILWRCCFPSYVQGRQNATLDNSAMGGVVVPYLFPFVFFYPSQLQGYFVGRGCQESSARWYPLHGVRCPSHHVDTFLETAGSGGPLSGGGGVSY